ncbi:MAG: hypothetical protein R6T87_02895, partial [Marinobacter sp.]
MACIFQIVIRIYANNRKAKNLLLDPARIRPYLPKRSRTSWPKAFPNVFPGLYSASTISQRLSEKSVSTMADFNLLFTLEISSLNGILATISPSEANPPPPSTSPWP